MDSSGQSENGEEMWISSEDYLAAIENEVYGKFGQKKYPNLNLEQYDITFPNQDNSGDIGASSKPMYTFCGAETAEHFFNKINGFYNEMRTKLNSLKNASSLDRDYFDEPINLTGVKLFKDLKETPEVQEQLKQIQQLDENIKNIINTYKEEKRERLKTQKEMCDELTNSKIEKDSCLFMGLSDFEEQTETQKPNVAGMKKLIDPRPNNFIKRNIDLAKVRSLSQCSLTDEEKIKIEKLMAENAEEIKDDIFNPFSLFKEEQVKIELTNEKLQDAKVNNKDKRWNLLKQKYHLDNDYLCKQSLVHIDEKIKKLRNDSEIKMEKKTEKADQDRDQSADDLNNDITDE